MNNDFFPLAVWYGASRSRAPMMSRTKLNHEEITKDLTNISNLGFNTVKYWIDWATSEPEPGNFNFSNSVEFLNMISEHGLHTVVQIYLDSAPNWIAREYPDSLFEAQSGHKVESQASPGYSFDHPGVKKEAQKFLTSIGKELRMMKGLHGWDIWSEPHIVNWSWFDYMGPDPWFEYGPNTRNRFAKWLKQKYRDISELNNTWYRTYKSWDEIMIPKYVTLSTFADVLDWQYFTVDKMQEELGWKVHALRNGDPDHIISSHSAITSIATSILEWGANGSDWEYAKEVDMWGTSFYPKHIGGMNPYDFSTMGFFLDSTRSSLTDQSKGYWVGEVQSGQGVEGFNYGVPVTGDDLELWAWICIATGSKGLFYYAYYPMSVGEEISGFGLVSQDGRLSNRSYRMRDISRVLKNNTKEFMQSEPLKSDVAILTDYKSKAFSTALRKDPGNIITTSIRGLYRIMNDENIQVDFLDTQNISTKLLSSYKVIFAPCLFVADDNLVSLLSQYVKEGGILLAEFRPGWSDPTGANRGGIPGSGFADIFGCQESYVEKERETTLRFEIENKVHSITYGNVLQVFDTFSAESVGINSDGNTIATSNKNGKGRGILVGALVSRMFEKTKNESVRDLYISILRSSGVHPWVSSKGNLDLRFRILKSGHNWILFGFNTGNRPYSKVKIDIDNSIKFKNASYMKPASDEISVDDVAGKQSVVVSFDANEIKVIKLV